VILIIVTIVMLYPFFFMLQSSLRSSTQFLVGNGFSLSSWRLLFKTIPILRQLLNSSIVTSGAIVLILIASSTAGYAFAKLRYRGSTTIFLLVIASMMVPMQSIIIPEFVNLSRLGMINHLYSGILVYAALGAPFGTFLMTTYFQSTPNELIDAAIVDGASYYGIFVRIMVPIAVPALIAIAVLQFVQIWGDLLIGLLFLQTPDVRTITVGLATLQSARITQLPVVMGGSLISAMPAAIVYLIFQRYIISGLTMGMGK
jgi:multiple sugar transport system permease protein/raffinose/stachyose/melibiose transport system permease protein